MSLAEVPLEVLLDNLLPLLPLASIAALARASSDLAALCADDTFWKRRLQADYNFSDAATARTSGGYRALYRGFHRAAVYVWGSAGEGRLGLEPRRTARGILRGGRPAPARLAIPGGAHIVALAAGGWSFHALDAQGRVHAWGQLDGMGFGLNIDSFDLPTKRAAAPLALALPEKITHISCGRAHAAALSAAPRVWAWTAWGRPCALPRQPAPPRQVECGWDYVAVLTRDGDVCLWWPFAGAYGGATAAGEEAAGAEGAAGARAEGGVVRCRPWTLDVPPERVRAPAEALPRLRGEEGDGGALIVKIAAGDKFLVALTAGGHVLRAAFAGGLGDFARPAQGAPRWEYLPMFSEVQHVRAHPEFAPEKEGAPAAPETLHITHVSAHFETFFAYTTGAASIVLQGTHATTRADAPGVTPALQHRGVIAVVLGDYHFGALTAAGTLLTWGAYSLGALGLGDPTRLPVGAPGGYASEAQRALARRGGTAPPAVGTPTEVSFGGRKVFVFTAAAAGWHSGALVIDLEDYEEEEDEEEEEEGHDFPPAMPGHWPFRIGLAGARGRGRGRGGM